MLRLAVERAVPIDPEPGEVGERRRDIGLARAAAVDIVDTEAETPPGAARGIVGEQRAIGVAEVELAGRTRRETGQQETAESSCCGMSRLRSEELQVGKGCFSTGSTPGAP